jgi:hypothetical protein
MEGLHEGREGVGNEGVVVQCFIWRDYRGKRMGGDLGRERYRGRGGGTT